jgi:uncharacterized protein (UPF0297 family)
MIRKIDARNKKKHIRKINKDPIVKDQIEKNLKIKRSK